MRRTVKAWLVIQARGNLVHDNALFGAKRDAGDSAFGGERVVRCTITYNDGQPRRARRAGEGGAK